MDHCRGRAEPSTKVATRRRGEDRRSKRAAYRQADAGEPAAVPAGPPCRCRHDEWQPPHKRADPPRRCRPQPEQQPRRAAAPTRAARPPDVGKADTHHHHSTSATALWPGPAEAPQPTGVDGPQLQCHHLNAVASHHCHRQPPHRSDLGWGPDPPPARSRAPEPHGLRWRGRRRRRRPPERQGRGGSRGEWERLRGE